MNKAKEPKLIFINNDPQTKSTWNKFSHPIECYNLNNKIIVITHWDYGDKINTNFIFKDKVGKLYNDLEIKLIDSDDLLPGGMHNQDMGEKDLKLMFYCIYERI